MKFNFTTKRWLDEKIKKHSPLFSTDNFYDLNEWKIKAEKKVLELLGDFPDTEKYQLDIIFIEKNNTYKKIRFIVKTEEDSIPCNLIIPVNATKKLPLILCIQGHMTGMHVSLGEIQFKDDEKLINEGMDFAIQAIKNGYAALTMELKGMGEKRFDLSRDGSTISCYRPTTAALLFGQTMIGMRVAEIMSVLNSLNEFQDEKIDLEQIYCLGHSGGGTTSLFLSSLDRRIKGLIISCAMCDFEYSILATEHCSCNYIPSLFKYFNMGDLGCLIHPRPLIIVAGQNDDIFLIEGVRKAYDKILNFYQLNNNSSKVELIVGNGGHEFFPDLVWPSINNSIHSKQ